jgi:hypothetical protein
VFQRETAPLHLSRRGEWWIQTDVPKHFVLQYFLRLKLFWPVEQIPFLLFYLPVTLPHIFPVTKIDYCILLGLNVQIFTISHN